MTIKDTFSCLIGAYYGVMEMDEYPLKEYVLVDLEKYIKNFISLHPNPDFSYQLQKEEILNHTSLKTKLQDALLILPKLNISLEFILMIKSRIEKIQKEE